MKLRPYQQKIINEARELLQTHRAIVVQAPTGSGKSFIIGYLSKLMENNNNACWNLVHRREILDELVKQCLKNNTQPGQILSGKRISTNKIQCGMLGTIYNKLKYLDKIYPKMINLDECHHGVANTFSQVINYKPDTKVIGFSATPSRLDNVGLNNAGFTSIISGIQTIDLINQGYLIPLKLYSSPIAMEYKKQKFKITNNDFDSKDQLRFTSQKIIIEDTLTSYKKYFNGNSCIVFCVSVQDCDLMEKEFNNAGWKAKSVHHKIPIEERKQAIQDLENGKLNILCSYNLFTEGISINILSGCIIRRYTQSLTIYLQQIGRVLRKSPNKKYGIVIDSAGNFTLHGHPLLRRSWSLDGTSKISENENDIKLIQCPYCGCWNLLKNKICIGCNADLRNTKPQKPDRIKIINKPLEEIPSPEPIAVGKYASDLSEIMEYEENDLDNAIIKRIDMIRGEGSNAFHRLEMMAKMFNKSNTWTRKVWNEYFKDRINA